MQISEGSDQQSTASVVRSADLIHLESMDTDVAAGRQEVCAWDLIRLDSDALPGLKTGEDKPVHLLDSAFDGQGSFPFPEHSSSLIDTLPSDFQSINSSTQALTVESACLETSMDIDFGETSGHDRTTTQDSRPLQSRTSDTVRPLLDAPCHHRTQT